MVVGRVSIRVIFAERNAKSFFLCASVLREKTTICAIIRKSFRAKLPYSAFAKLKFSAILQLEFCAISQFRKNQTFGDGVCFLEFNSSSAGRFCTKIRNRLSSKSLDNFSFGHAYFPNSGFFRHWLLSCIISYEIKKISEIWLKKIKNIIHTHD